MQFEKIVQQGLIWRGFQFSAILFLNVVLSRYLQAAGAGWVYFLTNFFSLAVLVGSFNIDSAYIYFSSNKNLPKVALSWFGLFFSMVVGVILIPIFYYYFSYYPIQNVSLSSTIVYGEYYVVGIVLANLFAGMFYAQRDYFSPGITIGIVNFSLSFYIIYLYKVQMPYMQVVTIYFIFFTLQGVLVALIYCIKNKVFNSFQWPTINQLGLLFRYSLIAFTANLLYFLVCKIDYWFVEHFRSQSELGNYIQASKMGQMLLIIPQILASVILPQIAEGINKELITKNILIISRLLMQFFMALFIIDVLFGQFVFSTVFGKSFYIMNLPFLLLLPGIFSLSVLTLFSAYYGGNNRLIVDVKGAGIALVFVVICNCIFTQKYGIVAAAIISTIGYTINLGYSAFNFFNSEKEHTLKDFFCWKKSDYLLIRETFRKG